MTTRHDELFPDINNIFYMGGGGNVIVSGSAFVAPYVILFVLFEILFFYFSSCYFRSVMSTIHVSSYD